VSRSKADSVGGDITQAERALEGLFRLSMSRRVHERQTTAVGVSVTRAGYAVLRCLDETGESTMGDLARSCAMDPAAAARQVKTLENDGLVERASVGGDARFVRVRLTDSGRDIYRRVVDVRVDYLRKVLSDWSPDDRADLVRLVDRLVGDLTTVPFHPPALPVPMVQPQRADLVKDRT
jgi:DNA-binding MarR family transcriptional regulator